MRGLQTICLAGLALLFTSCAGYQLGPTNGYAARSHSLQINPLVNKTLEPRIGDYFMTALRKDLQQDGTFRLNTKNDGDVIVNGEILNYKRLELTFVPGDVVSVLDYEIVATAKITARDRFSGKLIVDKEVTGYTALRAGKDLSSAERQAMPLLAEDLARKATALIVDGTW